jgi:ADP-heptose:LPS heptosyltransferase
MEVQRVLHGLLRQSDAETLFITPDKIPEQFDYHCPLLSLPLAFGTTLETIPAAPRYLWADEAARVKWLSRLATAAPRKKLRIGIVWRGSPTHQHDHLRSIDLSECLSLFGVDADWICLQKEIGDEDADALQLTGGMLCFGDELEDFQDTAALIDLLDLVISVDTSVAHLAGAMGKPVWVMLPYSPDWRWLLDRYDSPWYPSARLFRQSRPGDWAGVIERVAGALSNDFAPHSSQTTGSHDKA